MSRARDETIIAAFAQVLRQRRAAVGATQEQVAFEAGVDRTFVGLLETGKRQPSLSVIFALAQALGTTPELLVADTRKALKKVAQAGRTR
jgi:transcriptional regulator with XRE-family HTH domain